MYNIAVDDMLNSVASRLIVVALVCFQSIQLVAATSGSTTVATSLNGNRKSDVTSLVSVEVCQMETFEATCAADQVMWVESAQLGRLQLGRCVTETSPGYPIGCTLDVQPEMDSFCSGRRQCSVRIDSVSFTRTGPCHRDLKDHLWISYRCVKVVVPGMQCRNRQTSYSIVEPLQGFVASQTTEDTGCGLSDMPWIIQASSGQRINITMYDFAHDAVTVASRRTDAGSSSVQDSAAAGGYPRTCRVYATIREPSRGTTSTVCGLQGRVLNVFTSEAERVELRVMTVVRPTGPGAGGGGAASVVGGIRPASNDAYFLFHYNILGCADPPITDDGKMWRRRVLDTVTIGCTGTDHTWQMTCVGNDWKGTYSNCTPGYIEPGDITKLSYPLAMSSVVVVIIAVFVSSVILMIGVMCIRWRMNKERSRRIRLHQQHQSAADLDPYDVTSYSLAGGGADKSSAEVSYGTSAIGPDPLLHGGIRNEYARMRRQRLDQYRVGGGAMIQGPYSGAGSMAYGIPCRAEGGPYMEHIYESPDTIRRDDGSVYTPTGLPGVHGQMNPVDCGGGGHCHQQLGDSCLGPHSQLPPSWPAAVSRQLSCQPQQTACCGTQSPSGASVQSHVSTPKNSLRTTAKSAGNYSL
jgi:hypothetical protein